MSNVLVVKTSILGPYSQSSKLIDEFVSGFTAKHPAASVVVRDIGAEPLPFLDGELVGGLRGGDAELTTRQQDAANLSDTLIAELKAADYVVVAVPMYNFGIPVQLKSWFDLVCRAGVTFSYSETGPKGHITGKKVLVVTTTGGAHRNTATDLALAHAQAVLNFIGMTDTTVAYAESLNMGPDAQEKGLASARETIKAFLASV